MKQLNESALSKGNLKSSELSCKKVLEFSDFMNVTITLIRQ